MNRAVIINARRVARQIRAERLQREWEKREIPSLATITPVNKPRRILRPVW